jgi:hypothetical protein
VIEKMADLPQGIDGLRAIGRISREDYEHVFLPLLDEARRGGRRIRFLYQLGPEFEGFTAGAGWEDAKIGLHAMRLFDGCAVITDKAWMRELVRVIGFLMPCPVRLFPNQARQEAIAWLASLPEGAAIAHRLLPESGVIVVEVTQALRAQDFDALAFTADTWIEDHGSLQGLVIHAREFPGWQNLGSFLRHVRFVRDHHLKVKRIAFAAETKMASLVPRIAELFVHAEVQSFGYDELDRAVAWAGRRTVAPRQPASAR